MPATQEAKGRTRVKIEPYPFFDGRAEEALDFYSKALNGKVEGKMRYCDCPEPIPAEYQPPGGDQKLLHASIVVGRTRIMLSDGGGPDGGGFRGFSLSLQFEAESEVRQAFAALEEGGQVIMPLGPTFFAPLYGMVTDRLGVQWMVMTAPAGE